MSALPPPIVPHPHVELDSNGSPLAFAFDNADLIDADLARERAILGVPATDRVGGEGTIPLFQARGSVDPHRR